MVEERNTVAGRGVQHDSNGTRGKKCETVHAGSVSQRGLWLSTRYDTLTVWFRWVGQWCVEGYRSARIVPGQQEPGESPPPVPRTRQPGSSPPRSAASPLPHRARTRGRQQETRRLT